MSREAALPREAYGMVGGSRFAGSARVVARAELRLAGGIVIDGTFDERALRGVQTRLLVAATLRRLVREAGLQRGCRSEAARSPGP